MIGVVWQLVSRRCKPVAFHDKQSDIPTAIAKGTSNLISISLVVAFCFTPSVSMHIFNAWDCIQFSFDELSEQSFLEKDLAVRCDGSEEHKRVLAIGWALAAVWPIGMVVLYAVLLQRCYQPLLRSEPSLLVHATAFLHRDYKPE